jgi:hypothetical protein
VPCWESIFQAHAFAGRSKDTSILVTVPLGTVTLATASARSRSTGNVVEARSASGPGPAGDAVGDGALAEVVVVAEDAFSDSPLPPDEHPDTARAPTAAAHANEVDSFRVEVTSGL